MAGMNIKQIIDRLNAEFTGDTRKLVFWYDDNGEFVEDMRNVELGNAKVYFLQPDNQFATKLFLERQDTTTNYLIYAPFPKPEDVYKRQPSTPRRAPPRAWGLPCPPRRNFCAQSKHCVFARVMRASPGATTCGSTRWSFGTAEDCCAAGPKTAALRFPPPYYARMILRVGIVRIVR